MGRLSETREFLRRNERNIFDPPPTDNDNFLILCYLVAEPGEICPGICVCRMDRHKLTQRIFPVQEFCT